MRHPFADKNVKRRQECQAQARFLFDKRVKVTGLDRNNFQLQLKLHFVEGGHRHLALVKEVAPDKITATLIGSAKPSRELRFIFTFE